MDFYNQRMDGEFIYAMLFALLDSAYIESLMVSSLGSTMMSLAAA